MTKREDFLPGYTTTNEDMRWVVAQFPNAKRILTVAGSGDQALFYSLSGSKQIDTFDVTPYAGLIQNIKTAAIQSMDFDRYFKLIDNVHLRSAKEIQKLPEMQNIIPLLTLQNRKLLNNAAKTSELIFSRGSRISARPQDGINADEFATLKATVKGPFYFVKSDLKNLQDNLSNMDTGYDLINISNTFDSVYIGDAESQNQVLRNMAPRLKVGGQLIYMPQYPSYTYDNVRVKNEQARAVLEYEETIKNNPRDRFDAIIVFRRTR